MTVVSLVLSVAIIFAFAVNIVFRIKWEFEIEPDRLEKKIAIPFVVVAAPVYILPFFLKSYRFGWELLEQGALEILGKLFGAVALGHILGALMSFPAILLALFVSMAVEKTHKKDVYAAYIVSVVWRLVGGWYFTVQCFGALLGVTEWPLSWLLYR